MKQNDIKSLIDSIKQNRKRVGNAINRSDIVETKIYPEYKHCKYCKGTLYKKDGKPCECMRDYIRLVKYKETNISKKYYDTNLQFYKKNMPRLSLNIIGNRKTFDVNFFTDYMSKYIESFENRLFDGRGFMLIGECGCGKTGLLSYIVKELKLKNYDTYYIDTNELLELITKSYNNDESAKGILESLKYYDLLVLDDFGSEYGKESWRYNIFLKLIKNRYSKNKPTLMSSNLEYDDLFDGFSSEIIPRLSSVFSEIFDIMCLHNTIDMRKKIHKKTLYDTMCEEV